MERYRLTVTQFDPAKEARVVVFEKVYKTLRHAQKMKARWLLAEGAWRHRAAEIAPELWMRRLNAENEWVWCIVPAERQS